MKAQRLPSFTTVLAWTGFAVVLLSVMGWGNAGSAADPTDVSMLILSPVDDTCEAQCLTEDCEHPTGGGHEYYNYTVDPELPEEWVEGDDQHPCTANSSCESHNHRTCGPPPEAEEVNTLSLALARLQGPDLKRLIDRNPDRLIWNKDRRSVQLWGCGRRIVLSILLDGAQVRSLVEAEG